MSRSDSMLLVLGLVLAWVAACGSPGLTAVDEPSLVGSWTWVEASGGIAGVRITPASEGVQRRVVMGSREASLFQDGTLVRASAYRLTVGDPDGSFAGRDVVRWDVPLLGGFEEQGVALPHPDTLVLADGCCDGFVWTFARARP